jgi:hypothetical protein
MGMFDSVVWDDGRVAQVKCWGRYMCDYGPGDEVQLEPYIWTGESAEVLWANSPSGKPPTSYQLMVRDAGDIPSLYITVLDGRLFAWDGDRRPELPLVDNRGCPTDGSENPFATAVEIQYYESEDEQGESEI